MRLLLLLLTLSLATPLATAQQEVTLSPAKDNTLYEDDGGTLSNGAGAHLFAGVTNGGDLRRGLLAFDIAASVPAGATIESVELTMNMSKTAAGPQSTSLHRITTDWGEGSSDADGDEGRGADAASGDATWIHTFSSSQTWASPGGDFETTASASTDVDAVGEYTWATSAALVADVQQWLDNPATNFGWIVLGNETTNRTAKRFDTRENTNAPSLTVTFTPAVANEDDVREVALSLGSHPNPFHSATTISYTLERALHVRLEVFDVLGRRVATLADGVQPAGAHTAPLAGSGLPGGLYTIRLSADGVRLHHRMTLVR